MKLFSVLLFLFIFIAPVTGYGEEQKITAENCSSVQCVNFCQAYVHPEFPYKLELYRKPYTAARACYELGQYEKSQHNPNFVEYYKRGCFDRPGIIANYSKPEIAWEKEKVIAPNQELQYIVKNCNELIKTDPSEVRFIELVRGDFENQIVKLSKFCFPVEKEVSSLISKYCSDLAALSFNNMVAPALNHLNNAAANADMICTDDEYLKLTGYTHHKMGHRGGIHLMHLEEQVGIESATLTATTLDIVIGLYMKKNDPAGIDKAKAAETQISSRLRTICDNYYNRI